MSQHETASIPGKERERTKNGDTYGYQRNRSRLTRHSAGRPQRESLCSTGQSGNGERLPGSDRRTNRNRIEGIAPGGITMQAAARPFPVVFVMLLILAAATFLTIPKGQEPAYRLQTVYALPDDIEIPTDHAEANHGGNAQEAREWVRACQP